MRFGDGDYNKSWEHTYGAFSEKRPRSSIQLDQESVKQRLEFCRLRDNSVKSRGTKRSSAWDFTEFTECEHPPRKKRRLRLDLVTSMLSSPYSLPPTHIPARRACRTGPWARQRIAGRDLMRKAAIFNKIAMKRRTSGMRGVDHRKLTRRAALME